MQLEDMNVSVVGGGIGGLTAALALARRGARVELLERAPELREVGAGLQITPNGLAVLRALGLEDALGDAPCANAVSLRDYRAGREVLRLDLAGRGLSGGYRFVHRADLVALLGRAAREAGVTIRTGVLVDGVTPGASPQISVCGDCAGADLVVGADGLHSVVRPVLNGPRAPRFTGQVAWRAVVDNVTAHPAEARVHMGPGRHLVSYPLRGGRLVNLVAVREQSRWAGEGWHHEDDAANMARAFRRFGGEAARLVEAVERPGLWGLFRHPVAENWHGPGLALLGDAAHPTLPFLAQGANMALEDAWVLADALSGHGTLAERLHAYQTRRRARCARVVETATGNAWKYHLRTPGIRLAAHAVLHLAGRLAPGRMMSGFDWLYGHDVTA